VVFTGSETASTAETAAPGELLWEVRVNRVQWRAELFDETPHGFDVQLYRDTDFFASHRFDVRAAAIAWAHQQRASVEKGWTE